MLYELNEEKLKKEGKVSTKKLLSSLLEIEGNIESLIVCILDKEGYLRVYTNFDDSVMKQIGILECSKQEIIKSIYE